MRCPLDWWCLLNTWQYALMTLQIVFSTHPSSYRITWLQWFRTWNIPPETLTFSTLSYKTIGRNGSTTAFWIEQWSTTYADKRCRRQNVLLDWKIYLTSRSNTITVYAVDQLKTCKLRLKNAIMCLGKTWPYSIYVNKLNIDMNINTNYDIVLWTSCRMGYMLHS